MPITVNGEPVPDQLIGEEFARLRQAPGFGETASEPAGALRLRAAAEAAAIDRVLLRQEADKDSTPLDPREVERAIAHGRAAMGCREGTTREPDSEEWLPRTIERNMRFQRTMRSLLSGVQPPSPEAVHRVYMESRQNFLLPEEVHAAHIVRHVDEMHPEGEARAAIEAALAELEAGENFTEVAERYSDCKENGGDLGTFSRGKMVEEFDAAVFSRSPGERTGIFRTPFGFHIARVSEKRTARVATFQEAAPQIARALLALAEQEEMRRVFAGLRSRASISREARSEPEAVA